MIKKSTKQYIKQGNHPHNLHKNYQHNHQVKLEYKKCRHYTNPENKIKYHENL